MKTPRTLTDKLPIYMPCSYEEYIMMLRSRFNCFMMEATEGAIQFSAAKRSRDVAKQLIDELRTFRKLSMLNAKEIELKKLKKKSKYSHLKGQPGEQEKINEEFSEQEQEEIDDVDVECFEDKLEDE